VKQELGKVKQGNTQLEEELFQLEHMTNQMKHDTTKLKHTHYQQGAVSVSDKSASFADGMCFNWHICLT